MEIRQKWTRQMKNNIEGIMPPTEDPIDPSAFYVSDGLFSSYSSMRFRKLLIETGEEAANILTRSGTRCIHFEDDFIYAFLDKRIIKLQRDSLQIVETYREKVPSYADYVGLLCTDTFLIGNHNADFLTEFNVLTKQTHRRKIGGSCGIFQIGQNRFAVFNYQAILIYSPQDKKLCKLTDTERYVECAVGESGRAYLLCGGVNYSGPEITSAEYKILVYSILPDIVLEKTIVIPRQICGNLRGALHFRLSKDETQLYLYAAASVWVYSIHADRIDFQYTFSSDGRMEHIINVFPDKSFLLTSSDSLKDWEASGWELPVCR